MPTPVAIHFRPLSAPDAIAALGRVAVFVGADGAMGPAARRVDKAARGVVSRAAASAAFGKLKPGEAMDLAWPAGLAAEALQIVKLDRRAEAAVARRAGAAVGARLGEAGAVVLAEGGAAQAAEIAYGIALRAYAFTEHRTGDRKAPGAVTVMAKDPDAVAAAARDQAAVAEGVFFARDLVSEPANVLTTDDFAARLAAMQELGLAVEILEEDELKRLGMRTLLAVGQGSDSPSKVVVMHWKGAEGAPLALIGKGVVFDTGGISMKPAAGMEEMTMDMAGAAAVAGTMRALALRRAKAHVVGLVGLVENMPSGRAQRPGDIVRSMKGDTVEVINTDAEGRLVLADVMWYAQERFQPCGMIDLATLTGAIIVALGHENAGVFSNDDAFCAAFLAAAAAEQEGAWRMPLGEAYDSKLKSDLADMKNVGGREGGAVTAAQFLGRFVKPGVPWIHLDIAGTARTPAETPFAPKGATGWGVRALDRLVRDRYEKG